MQVQVLPMSYLIRDSDISLVIQQALRLYRFFPYDMSVGSVQLEEVHHRNQELKAQAHKAEVQKAKLFEQMEVLEHSFKSRAAENMALHDEIHCLRQKVQVKLPSPC